MFVSHEMLTINVLVKRVFLFPDNFTHNDMHIKVPYEANVSVCKWSLLKKLKQYIFNECIKCFLFPYNFST